MKFAFGIALFAVSTEAAITSFTLPTATECRTTQCNAASTAAAGVTAAQINACLASAPTTCAYTASYSVVQTANLPSCTVQSTWAGGAAANVYGYDLSALTPVVQGSLKTITGSITVNLQAAASVGTCTAKYLVTPIAMGATGCTAAATTGGTEVSYANTAQTISIPLTTALFPTTTPIGTNIQIGSAVYTNCGTSYASATLGATTYTMEHHGTMTPSTSTTTPPASGALSTMIFGLLPALYLMM